MENGEMKELIKELRRTIKWKKENELVKALRMLKKK